MFGAIVLPTFGAQVGVQGNSSQNLYDHETTDDGDSLGRIVGFVNCSRGESHGART